MQVIEIFGKKTIKNSILEMLQMEINNWMKSVQTIFCECGEEIPFVPDLEEMVRSIQAHAEMHRLIQVNKRKGKKEYDRIELQLTEKIILLIAGLDCKIS